MSDTKARLVAAAEELFAERGVDGVSLREITRESGAKNVIAVQYHFSDRDGVLRAILDKHLPEVDSRRNALLDEIEGAPVPEMRALASALVRPLAPKLADDDGGRPFLQIYADLMNRPRPAFEVAEGRFLSMTRWREMVKPLLDDEAVRLHRRFTAIAHSCVELARRARSGPHTDDRLFTSHLVDQVTALLNGPLSEETRRLAIERDASLSTSEHSA
ncbi:MAG TPA: helix-turn-helix domain-containing protein [Pseudonocardia sp.]